MGLAVSQLQAPRAAAGPSDPKALRFEMRPGFAIQAAQRI